MRKKDLCPELSFSCLFDIYDPPQLLRMTSPMAFRCVQVASGKARCVGQPRGRSMAQRPPCNALRKRPREDALLEADRSHQQRRVKILKEQLDSSEAAVELLKERLEGLEIVAQVSKELERFCCGSLRPATRSQRAELALRWHEADEEWRRQFEYWSVI